MKNYKKFTSILVGFFLCVKGFSLELSARITPSAMFPVFSGINRIFDPVGGGVFIDAGVTLPFLDFLSAGPDFGVFGIQKYGASQFMADSQLVEKSTSVLFLPVGAHAEATFYPFSRLSTSVGLGAGVVNIASGSDSLASVWYKVYGDIGFRITPEWTVGFNASVYDFQNETWFGKPSCAGVTAGVSVQFRFDTVKNAGQIEGYVKQEESVFPLFYTVYQNVPVGTITLVNNETAEIRDVVVKFRAQNYSASELECGRIKSLKKHKSVELDLYADFNDNILQFSEQGKIPGELVIEYNLLGKPRETVVSVIIPVYNRNQVRWTDNEVIASYISAKNQEVLEFSKYVVGIARNNLRTGLNRNMQFAMYLFEGLRLGGISCIEDAETPYRLYHTDPSLLDYIQYPFQTMLYKNGDVDDLGILFMALLESVGIQASYIPMEDDFIVCFNTEINASKADSFFDGYDRFIVIGDEVWIPMTMSTLKEGFINSWYKAIMDLTQADLNEEPYELVSLEEARYSYPAAGFSSGQNIDIKPDQKALVNASELDLSRYITTEFGPRIASVQAQMKKNGASTELSNKLGLLYVRAGMYSNAIPVFEYSAKSGSTAAMNNLGNIMSLQKKYQEALSWYRKVLEIDPKNKTATKGENRMLDLLKQ